jgi:uncharacterized membrane protein YphA (DoxX/SURF4 family)
MLMQETSSMSVQPDLPAELCQETEGQAAAAPSWGLPRRLGFRFLFSYFVLFAFPFPIGTLPWTEKVNEWFTRLVDLMVVWVGANVLGIERAISVELNGSGDRTYDYVLVLCQLILAAAAAVVWSLIDRRTRRHGRLLDGLHLYVRVYVGTMMLSYGFAKIFDGQFPAPAPGQLMKAYGDSSPMNLLWTFMGVSRPYTMFGGLMEAIPGTLLFFRRTATTGALLLLAVMGNVVLLNFCYDVPVKIFSSHLWLMCLFVAWPALPRLARALVLDRSVPPAPPVRAFAPSSRRARIATTGLYALLIAALAYATIVPEIKQHFEVENQPAAVRAVRDLFTVDEMTIDGAAQPLATRTSRWNRVWVRYKAIRIYGMDGRSELYVAAEQIKGPGTLVLRLATDPESAVRARLDLRQDGEGYTLDGDFEGKKVHARLARMPVGNSLLTTRGFHWINDVPFNR